MVELTHETVRFDDQHHIHVAQAGPPDGPPLVMLHGWPQTWRCWRHVMPHLSGYRLVMPDLRGLGGSGGPEPGPDGAGYAKREIAAELITVLDVLGIGRAVIAGHDWGGVVATHAAALLGAERARGLVVVDVTVPNDLGAGVDISQGGGRWHHAFHRTSLAETLIVGNEEAYYRWFYATLAATPDAIGQSDVAAYVAAYRGAVRTRAGLALYRATPLDVADSRLIGHHGLAMPVLALGGGSSWGRGTEPQECLEFFAADVTGGVVAGSGHFVPEEAPEELAERIGAFVEGLPA